MPNPEVRKASFSHFLTLSFLACLLGNFVDQFDLYLFSSLRVISLKDLGLQPDEVLSKGVLLLNAQMLGMLLGGIIGGILGDKRGRLSVLFGSIILYSVANLANSFVTTVDQYVLCRFFAGLGLAAELGVCITVVLETLPQRLRGYGTMLVMAFGHTATLLSALCANLFDWRTCYFLGGGMGLLILFLRSFATEPEMFKKMERSGVPRGNFFRLLTDWSCFKRYLKGIFMTAPTWFTFGVLIVFAPELGRELGITEPIRPERYLPFNFAAVVLGDISSGILGQVFKTRRKIILLYLIGLASMSVVYLTGYGISLNQFYLLMGVFGFFAGYAVLSFTAAAEQFGTNLRSTVATSTPNWVRACAILFTLGFSALKPKWGAIPAASLIGAIAFTLALLAALSLEETYGKDLDYIE